MLRNYGFCVGLVLLPVLLPLVESVAPVLSLVPFFDLRVVSVSVLLLLLVVLDVPDVLGLVVDEPGLVVEGDVEEPCPGVAWANVSGETAIASAIANTAFVIWSPDGPGPYPAPS